MRWFITKRHLVALIGILVATILILLMSGCIPVTVRPEFAEDGKPIALPVTPTGSVSPEGVFTPVYPVSDQPPAPPNDWMGVVSQLLTLGFGVLVGGGAAVPLISRAKTALRIACQFGEASSNLALEAASRPPEDAEKVRLELERNKMIAMQQQVAAGVHKLTQAVRGKS